jgi:histidinol-phosphate aminotransferase
MSSPALRAPSARSGFDALSVYDDAAQRCAIDLSDNTNLWGMPPSALRALHDFKYDKVTRYPSAYTSELKESLARYTGAEPSMIVTGCGSDDVLDSAIRAFGNPGGALACCDPTFSMIPVLARLNGLTVTLSSFSPDGGLPVESLLASNAEIIYICSPNNPTGRSASREEIETIARSFDGLVIVDHAYAEYAEDSLMYLTGTFRNVLVTRTFSKAFGMAGLRVGYAVGNTSLIAEVEKSRGPYKVGALGSVAAIAALENDTSWIRDVVSETIVNRNKLIRRLESFGYSPLPSDANFVLVPVTDSASIVTRAASDNVGIRGFRNLSGIGDAVRITVGPWSMMEQILEIMGQK